MKKIFLYLLGVILLLFGIRKQTNASKETSSKKNSNQGREIDQEAENNFHSMKLNAAKQKDTAITNVPAFELLAKERQMEPDSTASESIKTASKTSHHHKVHNKKSSKQSKANTATTEVKKTTVEQDNAEKASGTK